MYVFTRTAQKEFNKLPANTQARILSKIELLDVNPEALKNNIKKLQGVDAYRLRVGDYRVVFNRDGEILLILRVAPRGGAYD